MATRASSDARSSRLMRIQPVRSCGPDDGGVLALCARERGPAASHHLSPPAGGEAGAAGPSDPYASLLFSPVLVALVGFHGRSGQRLLRPGQEQVLLDPLSDRVHLPAGDAEFSGQPGRGLTLGNAPQDQKKLRRALPGAREDGAAQRRVVSVARFAPQPREGARALGDPPVRAPAPGTLQSVRMQVFFEPDDARGLIHQLIYRPVDRGIDLPQSHQNRT